MANLSPAVLSLGLTVFMTLGGAVIWLWMAWKYKSERLDRRYDELKEISETTDKSNELLRRQVEERNEVVSRFSARMERLDNYNRRLVRKVLVLESHVTHCERRLRENKLPVPEIEEVEEL